MTIFGKLKTLIGNNDKKVPEQTVAVDEFSPEALDCLPQYNFVEALHAARQGNLAKIQDYLNFNKKYALCKNWDGNTLLHEAARLSRSDMMELLLNAGAEVDLLYKGKTPLIYAVEGDASQTTHKTDEQLVSYRERRKKTTDLLLQHGANPSLRNELNETPLHIAAKLGISEVIDLLFIPPLSIDDMTQSDGEGQVSRTPLLLAARYCKDKTTMSVLLKKGANPNIQDSEPGYAPLHYIASYRSTSQELTETDLQELVTLLLDHQADVNLFTQDSKKQTPLHLAIVHHHLGLVDLLIQCGANVNAKDAQGRTAIAIAASRGDAEMVAYFISKGADIYKSKALFYASACKHSDAALKLLIEKRYDVNMPDEEGYTPLYAAISAHSLRNVKLLLDSGAEPGLRPPKGPTITEHAFGCWGSVANLSKEEVSPEKKQIAADARDIVDILGGFKQEKKKYYF